MLMGIPLETIYWYLLLVCAGLAVLMVIFGDVLEFDGAIDPLLIIPFLAFIGLFGHLGEKFLSINSWLLLIMAVSFSGIIVFLLNFYVVVPMRKAEATLSISEKDMEGQVATVITPIPLKGMGEIQLKSVTGSLSRPAAFYGEETAVAPQGSQVLIIEIRERVCYVVPYEKFVTKS
ncbi:membrane protein implicated in regulation of membrane protease activity [Enterococcus sp. PF1-24]|nr:membrane protein implicated in regulation of membrane protease activity [Enterococcus sp. PFB1-1]MDH6402199.1 membrane protein implicated in regulation of membrane protease activity [Enterococcus sp. PF1-24]